LRIGCGFSTIAASRLTAWRRDAKEESVAPRDSPLSSPPFGTFSILTDGSSDDGTRNWDHRNLIIPVYFDLMTRFPAFQPEEGYSMVY
jgi:hypothetical protein